MGRTAALGFALVVLAACTACSHGGERRGFGGPHRSRVVIVAVPPGPEASQVRVLVDRENRNAFGLPDTQSDCVYLDASTRVYVDGVALEQHSAGGFREGPVISGIATPGHCASAVFQSPAGHEFERTPQSRVTIVGGRWNVRVRLRDLVAAGTDAVPRVSRCLGVRRCEVQVFGSGATAQGTSP